MIRILLVHGIGVDRRGGWSRSWQSRIDRILGASKMRAVYEEFTWEAIYGQSLPPAMSSLQDLLQDLGALQCERVEVAAIQRISQLSAKTASTDKLWIIAHSLGTAIVYKALAHLEASGIHTPVDRLITLGSPLWLSHSCLSSWWRSLSMLMPRAEPLGLVSCWTNFAGIRDQVAGRGLWGRPIGADQHIRCWSTHDADRYLETKEFAMEIL